MNGQQAETTVQPGRRMAWLDILRGIALIAMASYHLMWDLADFGYLDPSFPSTGWPRIYARAIATTFIFVAGFSMVLAYRGRIRWKSFWIRFLKIAAAAALVTVATWFAIPQGFIFFGILHAIAAASLIGLLFLRLPVLAAVLVAVAAIAAPHFLRSEMFNAPWLWWVGLSKHTHTSFDYVPLLPWLAPFLLGMATARLGVVADWLRQNARGITAKNRASAVLAFLGRHSLVVYLVHQPVLISIVYAISLAVPAPQATAEAKYIGSCETNCGTQQDAGFCRRFCACTLERLQDAGTLVQFQSGAISVAEDEGVTTIAIECTTTSQ